MVWLKRLGLALAALAMSVFANWIGMALYFHGPGDETAKWALILAFGALTFTGVLGVFWRRLRPATWLYGLAGVIALGWWATIQPRNDRDWAPQLARGVTARIHGNRVFVQNIRDFAWRSEEDFTPNWVERGYNLDDLTGVDLFMTYWMGPDIAHMIVSFGFADARQLAFSVEIRRPKTVEYAPVPGFFKSYELVIIAADERDVIGLRHVRPEDTRLFRVRVDPKRARGLLLEYLRRGNELARTPRFYHTIFSNCTTEVFSMVRAAGFDPPFDWRLLANGKLPELFMEERLLDERHSVADLARLGQVDSRWPPFPIDSVAFSTAIRNGVPIPTPAPVR
jgi:hypothetical protein